MDNDIELLYKAGRIQGWTDYPQDSIECGTVWHLDPERTPFGRIMEKRDWNPLEDSGAALELAVKLGMEIGGCYGPNQVFLKVLGPIKGQVLERIDGDALQATRRAIVRMAAAMYDEGLTLKYLRGD